MAKEKDLRCSIDGCDRKHKSRGYCSVHYQQWKRGVPLTAKIKARDRNGPTHCTAPDCTSPVKSRGLCKAHYARLMRHGHIGLERVPKQCSIPDCAEEAHAKGLCTKHYYRLLRAGTTDDPNVRTAEQRKCSVGSCLNIAIARGLCQTHYARWQRHSSVTDTRPVDWGAREKHPLYTTWNTLMRYSRPLTCERWHDLWNFVADIGDSRPSPGHLLTRKSDAEPFGPENFYWRAPRVSGKSPEEKAERAAYMRDWNAANPDKLMEGELRKRYGITFADYQKMHDAQGGKCAICGQEETRIDHRTKRVSRLAVDHCHEHGHVRALLCHGCNNSIGHFKDDPARLRAAAAYLEHHAPEPPRETTYTIPGEPPWPPGFVN